MKFSVLMSIYAKETPDRLEECLESLKNQTLQANELVLVEDGELPTALLDIIDTYSTALNMVSVKLAVNKGLATALNKGLKVCKYDLIVRMDSDDICYPERFEKQVTFMKNNPNIAVSSSCLEEFGDNGEVFSLRQLPLDHEALVRFAKTRSPISHAAAIFRKNAVLAVGGYPLFKRSQDVALWSLMLTKGYKFANLPDVLYKVRAGSDFMARSGLKNLKYEYAVIKYQKSIGFLSWYDFTKNISLRFILAIMPSTLKNILYQFK